MKLGGMKTVLDGGAGWLFGFWVNLKLLLLLKKSLWEVI